MATKVRDNEDNNICILHIREEKCRIHILLLTITLLLSVTLITCLLHKNISLLVAIASATL